MEGLIPLVIHAIKKNRKLCKYRSLSDDDDVSGSIEMSRDGSSHRHHRRTRSEFHLPPVSAIGSGFGRSRTLREDPSVKAIRG